MSVAPKPAAHCAAAFGSFCAQVLATEESALFWAAPVGRFEAKAAADAESYDVTQYGYKYHAKYGSPELDHDGKENAATAIKVAGATVSPDKLKVRLKLEGWKTGYVTMVRSLDVKNGAGESLVNDTFWYTLNQLPK